MLEYDQIIDALIKRAQALSDRAFIAPSLCAQLARFDDADVAHVLDDLFRGAVRKQSGYLGLLQAFSEFSAFREQFQTRLSSIFDYADTHELIFAAEWLAPLPIREKTPKGLLVHDDLQNLTLGERRYLARGATPGMIEKLLIDPDPAVIHNLLNHPRLKEQEVVRICAKTPNHPDVMREVFRHPKWFARYPVKKALLNNPATPPRLVVLLLTYLSRQDLKELLRSARFSPGLIHLLIDLHGQSDTKAPKAAQAPEPEARRDSGRPDEPDPTPDDGEGTMLH
jgi:hypothetical protein